MNALTGDSESSQSHLTIFLLVPFVRHMMRPRSEGEPDVVIPSVEAYHDKSYPTEKLFIVGVKTTCKDRWRQVLNEAPRVPDKHILTIQKGISAKQLNQMHTAQVTLVVPKKLHSQYPKGTPITLLDVEGFIRSVRS